MNKKELLKEIASYECNEDCEKCPYSLDYDLYLNDHVELCMSELAVCALAQLEQKENEK